MRVDGITLHVFTAIIFFAIGMWYADRRGARRGGLG